MATDYSSIGADILAPKAEPEQPADEEVKTPEAEATKQEPKQETSPPEKPEDAAPAETTEETEEEKVPELPEEIDVDGESVPVEELKDSYKLVAEARQRIAQANERIEMTNALVSNLLKRPADSLLAVFTDANKGDRAKAYKQVVDMAEKIVAFHIKYESLPEGDRKALEARREVDELKRKLAEKEQAEQQARIEKEADLLEAKFEQDITKSLKAAGLDASDKDIAAVADILLEAKELGIKATPEKAVARLIRMRKQKKEKTQLDVEDLPEELIEKIRKMDLQKVKDSRKPGNAKKQAAPQKETPAERPVKVVGAGEWEEAMRGNW